MATYNSYSELQSAVALWLNREDDPDILARAAEFIGLCEARIRRKQEWFVQVYSFQNADVPLVVTANPMELPNYVYQIKEMWCASDRAKNPITVVTPTLWRDLVASNNDAQGSPTHAVFYPQMDTWMKDDNTRTGPKVKFWPTPSTDGSFSVDFEFVRDVQPLSTDTTTNGLFLRHPDLYLYGALVESAPFYEHDSRMPLWETRFKEVMDEINRERERAELGSSNRRVRLRSF